MTTKITTDNIASETLTTILGPKVSSIVYPGDDTAANTAGGDSITLLGSGFNNGASVIVNGTSAGVVTVVSSTQITFTAPAQTAGTYVIYVINSDGGTAISIPGISYSGTPTWSTTAGNIGVGYETGSISTTVTATGDAPITYSVVSGTLPTGSTLDTSSGLISGTASATASSTTYSFTIKASDAQNQDTNRAFSITVNPDVVTWSSPANSTTYEVFKDSAIANVEMSATSASGGSITYTADTLPTGLSITGANIAGTPTVAASTSTTLTATSTSTRSATRTINWIVSIANDTYFKNVTLLLNGETTVTPFISDASTNSFGLTIQGDTKPVLFNPYTPGYYSNYFDGTGDYLTVPDNVVLQLGSGDFTVEFWINYNSITGYQSPFTKGYIAAGDILLQTGNGNGALIVYLSGSAVITESTGANIGQWYHYALVRSGTTVTLYRDGVSRGTATSSVNFNTTDQLAIGAIGKAPGGGAIGDFAINGYMSNFRLVKGTAVYTSAFTPSTTPLTAIANTSLLTCQSNRFIDNSTNNFTITKFGNTTVSSAIPFTPNSSYSTYGSTYFDGTSDYLSASGNTAFAMSTGNFTYEAWINPSSISTYFPIISQWPALTTSLGYFLFSINSSRQIELYYDGQNYSTFSSTTVTLNTWNHVAIIRSGSTITGYINGVVAGTVTWSGIFGASGTNLEIGGTTRSGGNLWANGYISEVRIVKGTAVYTTAFTPPTVPLTAIANTSLLTLQYNGGATNQAIIDNSNFNNIITRFGNTSQGSFSPYSVTGWSNYFDGTGDYLSIADNDALDFGTGDFTIECWVNFSDISSNKIIFDKWSSGDSAGWQLYYRATGSSVTFYTNNAVVLQDPSSSTITAGQWYHISVTRSGTTAKLFVNGSEKASATVSTTLTNTNTLYVGVQGTTTTNLLTGYVSNVRLVKGTALYTSNFTPSTTPLTTISGTSLLTCQSNRFIDNSPNSFTLTKAGDVSVQAFDPFGSVPEAVPISYSVYFDGTGDYLTLSNNTLFGMGSGNFTIEFWMYQTALSNYRQILDVLDGNSVGRLILWVGSDGTLTNLGQSGNQRHSTASGAIVINTWTHVALVRSSGTTKFYINGTQSGSNYTDSTNYTCTTGTVYIGINSDGSTYPYMGYLSNFRMVKGTAVYTSNFTPPTSPLTAVANTSLLTCQSTRMIDNSTNNFTLTATGNTTPRIFNPFGYTAQSATSYTSTTHGGSIYLDGTGDYLSASSSTAFAFPSGVDFTVEGWVYLTSYSPGTIAGSALIGTTGGATTGWFVNVGQDINTLRITSNASGSWADNITVTSGNGIPLNTWTHIAFVRSGGSLVLYKNGVSVASMSGASAYNFTSPNNSAYMGFFSDGPNTRYVTGNISDVRVVKGTAIYTSNFIPLTTSLTATANTSLLLNFNNGGIVDQHGSNVIETLGNAQLSTAVKKYNNASMYFDGTGDYLYSPPNLNYAMGSGDFTIEFWYYPVSQNPAWNPNIMGNYNATWTTNKWAFHAPHSSAAGKYSFWVNNIVTQPLLASTSNVTNGAWVHLAITRSGSTWRMFVNGTIEATATSNAALDGGTAASMDGFYVGANFYSGEGGRYINAYIDDLRITKGYARYTANFTAPTSAFITK